MFHRKAQLQKALSHHIRTFKHHIHSALNRPVINSTYSNLSYIFDIKNTFHANLSYDGGANNREYREMTLCYIIYTYPITHSIQLHPLARSCQDNFPILVS